MRETRITPLTTMKRIPVLLPADGIWVVGATVGVVVGETCATIISVGVGVLVGAATATLLTVGVGV